MESFFKKGKIGEDSKKNEGGKEGLVMDSAAVIDHDQVVERRLVDASERTPHGACREGDDDVDRIGDEDAMLVRLLEGEEEEVGDGD